ncbi:MAG: thermonuclease family protein [Hyphomonadaceae bacterium]
MLCACEKPEPLETLEPGERGRVVRILDGDTLVLETGLTVRLVGIEAPSFARRRSAGDEEIEDDVYARESHRMLEDMAMGREVQLFYPGLTRDRYDRALAHVRTDDALGAELWLNIEMLKRGGVRFRIYPDTARLGELLLEAEQAARLEKAGLWRKRAYRIAEAQDRSPEDTGFFLMTGELGKAVPLAGDWARAVCARELDGGAVILDIMPASSQFCSADDPRVLVRGYLKEGRITLTHPLNLERLEPE